MFSSIDKNPLIQVLSTISPAAQFVTIKEYENNNGDICNYSFLINFSYQNLLQRSLAKLATIHFPSGEILSSFNKKIVFKDFVQAKNELQTSFRASLAGTNHSFSEEAYEPIPSLITGKPLHGCKLHSATGLIHIQGILIHRLVLSSFSEKKIPNSAPKTIIKNWIRHQLPIGKIVQFCLEPGRYGNLTINHVALLSKEIPGIGLNEISSIPEILSWQEK